MNVVGCLMSCAWKDDRCRIGLILGTGTNACYLEEIKDIHTIDKEKYQDQVKHFSEFHVLQIIILRSLQINFSEIYDYKH